MSAAEIKAKGLDGTIMELSNTFGGAATVQANTFEGQIARLKVGFDEAKESVGAALLPALKNLLDYFTNTLIPKLIDAKNQAIDPIKKAFEDNKETLTALWKFIKDYLVPIFETVLVTAIKNAGTTIAGIVTVISKVFNAVRSVVDNAIDGINAFIRAYNAIPILPDVKTITKPGWVSGTSTGAVGNFQMSTGTTLTTPSGTITPTPTTPVVTATPVTPNITTPAVTTTIVPSGNALTTGIDLGRVRMGEQKGDVIINVNSPSIIDREGFSRAVVDALNESADRGTGGGGGLYAV